MKRIYRWFIFTILYTSVVSAYGMDFMKVTKSEYIIKNFEFENGETLPDLKIAYRTFGNPKGEPILLLHGTHGNGGSMISDTLIKNLYAPNKALDARKYFLIAPDSIGTGDSTKPSDGLKASFPVYNYHDIVKTQYKLLKNHLKIDHLRSIFGYSMGGMLAFDWATMYPDFMDSIVPTAAFPIAMSGKNWAMRKLLIDSIRRDPVWDNGNYTEIPPAFLTARIWFGTAFYLSNKKMSALYPTPASFNEALEKKYSVSTAPDANDAMYQWGASRDFAPEKDLNKIKAYVLLINEDGDPRNPADLDALSINLNKIPHIKSLMIKADSSYSGHGTVYHLPWLYESNLSKFLLEVPQI